MGNTVTLARSDAKRSTPQRPRAEQSCADRHHTTVETSGTVQYRTVQLAYWDRVHKSEEEREAREREERERKAAEVRVRRELEERERKAAEARVRREREEREHKAAEERAGREREERERKAAEERARREREERERKAAEERARRERGERERKAAEERARREREEREHKAAEERAGRECEERIAAEKRAWREFEERQNVLREERLKERVRKAFEARAERERQEQERIATKEGARQSREAAAEWQTWWRRTTEEEEEEEEEGAVGYAQVPPPLSLRLPEVCYRHNSRQGCTNTACQRLHICKLFLADICKHGVGCRFGHSLTTVHNQMVCNNYDLNTELELALIQKLRYVFEEKGEFSHSMYLNNLEMCFKFGSTNPCEEYLCNRIHICRQYIAGRCGRAACKFGHDLHSTHNNGVLSRHKATKMRDDEIMDTLRQNQPAWAVKSTGGPTSSKSVQSGAFRRQQSSGTGEHVDQDDGLSKELQCPVCLEMFNRATTLGCGHTFCAGCVENVRVQGGDNKCPMCRTRITSCTRSVTLDNVIRSIAAK